MTYKLGAASRRRLALVHPDLQTWVNHLITITPVDFSVMETLRTLARQQELLAAGATHTLNSRHLTGHAADLGAYVGGSVRWDMNLYYQLADAGIQACRDTGVPIRWGGAWARLDRAQGRSAAELVAAYTSARRSQGRKAFIDGPHFELPATLYP